MGYPRAFHYAAAIALGFISTPAIVAAQEKWDGNQLLLDCGPDDTSWRDGVCAGSIQGIVGGMYLQAQLSKGTTPFCIREGVTNRQIRDTVVLWLRNNPSKRDWSKAIVVANALKEGFPCPAK